QDQQGEIDTYAGGSKDWLGFDDGSRALPDVIARATANGERIPVGDPRETEYGLAFKRNYSTQTKKTTPVPGLSMSIGDTFSYRGKKFGYNLAGMYGDRYNYNEVERTSFNAETSDSQLSVDGSSTNRRSRRDVNLSGMLNLGMDLGKYADIRANTLMLRKSVDRVERRVFRDQDNTFDDTSIEWEERQLFTQMLSGTHQIGKNKKRLLKWRGNYSKATMVQPDSRTFRVVTDEGAPPRLETQPRTTERTFGSVNDQVREGEVSFETPVLQNKNFQFLGKVGLGQLNKERTSRFQRFGYEINPELAGQINGNPNATNLDEVCTDAVIRAGACTLRDTTQPNDRFEAEQELRSYFVDTDTKIFERVRVNLGVRFEDSYQKVATFQGEQLVRLENTLNMKDYLPAAGMTFFLSDNVQFRLGYSETISRPAFKDLSPEYYDDERDRTVSGNAQLSGTVITNRDARLEWYFGNQENLSIGYFDKDFLNPIEEVAGSFQNGRLTYSEGGFQLANVGNARVKGFEVEFRKNFSFISSHLQPLAIGGNYAKIDSEMSIFADLASQVTNTERPLQGQSPYVVNLNIDYDNKDTGTNATVLFNVFGRRIDTVGTDKRPDTYQESFNQLDFVFSQSFGKEKRNKVRFKVQNILNPEAVLKIGDEVAETFKKGRRAGISFTRTF
ncbi:MAG: TonB-dependent receptor, partial [Halobacteriovoraceae bacterium]|nr:TonB-dependent receptor [Halobacteriovoraceae bacterium]